MLLIITVIYLASLAVLVVSQGPKKWVNASFAVASIFIAAWLASLYGLGIKGLGDNVEYGRSVFTLGLASTASLLWFLNELMLSLSIYLISRRSLILYFMAPAAVVGLVGLVTNVVVKGVVIEPEGLPTPVYGLGIAGYLVSMAAVLGCISWIVLRGSTVKDRRARVQIRITAYSALFSITLAVFTNLIIPFFAGNTNSSLFVPFAIMILMTGLSYAIVKHGLFDMKQVVVRSATYILTLIALAGIYYLIAYMISRTFFADEQKSLATLNFVNFFIVLVLTLSFQPIKQFFDKITNTIFFRNQYEIDDFITNLGSVLATTTDLRNLLQRAALRIGDTLKSEQAFFYVEYGQNKYITAGTPNRTSLPIGDITWLKKHIEGEKILVASMLPANSYLYRLLKSHAIEILMPLVHDGKTMGYLALGEQRVNGYTSRDIKVLTAISNELVMAIQNSLSIQEIRDINANLEQRIEAATAELRTSNARLKRLDATKDEFISMASHQLRTPLTSIKGYLSMVLEGDAGKITKDQRHLLQEAFVSSERMVHLIHDFLNVSRLQNGKFTLERRDYDIVTLVQGEINGLQRVAETRDLKVIYKSSVKSQLLSLDETKIRQVVMNFIDNAIFYSNPKSAINVTLEKVGDAIELRVTDTGIGVPKAEQEHLFTKFFRAANARKQRPDGTGVGIFLAKKVINAHGGEIIFESTEGKGSTFGFTLPLK